METYGEYLTRNLRAKGLKTDWEAEAALETFSQHRYGYRERFSQPSLSQWRRDIHLPDENKRIIIADYFGETYPERALIEAMRRLLALETSHAA